MALAVYSALMLVPPTRPTGQARRVVRALDLLLLNLCVLVVAGELGLRAAAAWRPSVLLTRPDAGIEESLEASRYPPGTVRHGFPVNSGGHYDEEFLPKAKGRRRVVCIGDSFSAGVVHHAFHFTTVAERRLDGVRIDNMGLPAVDLPHYQLLLAREALPLKPDAVVVNLFVGNDLSWPLPAPKGASSLAGWLNASNLLVLEVPRRLLILSRQGRRSRAALEDRGGHVGDADILRTRREILDRYPWYDDPLSEPPTLDREWYLTIERRRAAQLCRQPRNAFVLRLERLEEMRAASRSVPLAVMIIPDVFQVEDSLWSEVAPAGADRARRMRSVAITRKWLEEHSFAYLDLLPVLRGARPLSDGELHLYKLNDTHFNARGNAIVGRALADFLKRWPAGQEDAGISPPG
jgi:lysophospholipase L1-like esterase